MKIYLVTVRDNVEYEESIENLGIFSTLLKAQAAAVSAVLEENKDRNYNRHTAEIVCMNLNQQPIPQPTLRVTRTGEVEPWTEETTLYW